MTLLEINPGSVIWIVIVTTVDVLTAMTIGAIVGVLTVGVTETDVVAFGLLDCAIVDDWAGRTAALGIWGASLEPAKTHADPRARIVMTEMITVLVLMVCSSTSFPHE